MTAYLPPNLLALFAPRDPIPYMPPLDKLPHEKKSQQYIGVAQFMRDFEDPKDTPPPTRVETKEERKERKRKERQEQHAYKLEQELAMWDPASYTNGTTDPYKSLFVARINYDSSESKLRREFEVYGPIRKISVAHNQKTGKPRGYAFIEYEHERDMHSAYKHADGKKIDGRRVLVDVERSRTVKGWRPRRLGGGLGGTRKGGPDVNTKYSGRDDMGMRDDREEHERSRSPVERRERRRRSRSRERDRGEERERGGRRGRSREREPRRSRRSRSRERRKSREREKAPEEEDITVVREGEEKERERKRSRSRDRKRSRRSRSRERKRSRSRDRKRSRRSRSRDRSRRSSRDRKDGGDAMAGGDMGEGGNVYDEDGNLRVKEEPSDEGYGQTNTYTTDYPDPESMKHASYDMPYHQEDAANESYDQYQNGDHANQEEEEVPAE